MQGLMQQQPLLISSILRHAARHHARGEIVSKTTEGAIHRTTYAALEARARRLARVLGKLGVGSQDRVGTLAWNDYRHLEVYYAAPGMGAICHTINPRLHPDDIAYIITHAGDARAVRRHQFLPLLETIAPRVKDCVRAVVLMTDAANMPALALPAGHGAALLRRADGRGRRRLRLAEFRGNHRQRAVLHLGHHRAAARACCTSTAPPSCTPTRSACRTCCVCARSTACCRWCRCSTSTPGAFPTRAALTGAALVLPGRHLDGASLHALLNAERVTFQRRRADRLAGPAGSTCAPAAEGSTRVQPHPDRRLRLPAAADRGVRAPSTASRVEHAWGMTELSPVGTYNAPKPAHLGLSKAEARPAAC